jgi:dTDP-4-dehydrorhamnose reductase
MILATGANGMLGSYFKEDGILKTDIVGTLPTLDVTDYDAVYNTIKEYKPEFVLHLAAETDVDKCEYDVDHAYKVNYWGTYNIARACQELGPIMIYISTGQN